MYYRSQIFLIALVAFAGCVDAPAPLIRSYEEAWRVNFAEQFDGPDIELYLAGAKPVSDGSLLLVVSKHGYSIPSTGIFVIKISRAGEVAGTVTLSEEYEMRGLYEDSDGLLLTFQIDNNLPNYIQYRIDAALNTQEIPFTFNSPSTFYRVDFTPAGILIIEYDGNLEGMRIKRFTYDGTQEFDIGHNNPPLRSFPWIDGNRMFFLDPIEPDTMVIHSIDQVDGRIHWRKTYTSTQLFGKEGIWLGQSFIMNGFICASYYENDPKRFNLATINPWNGRLRSSIRTTVETQDEWPQLAALTRDGGCILRTSADGLSWLYKTDAAGTIGWTGQFGGYARPVETESGDLFVITDQLVIKLDARKGRFLTN
ncbi:MAG: hypothetical protein LOY03_05270 [Cyclobacteriaceae bacterium]|jgi:hypothetical protein|nr:hypothetical protein [Cyclobacteriaceae bacterium]